MSLQKIEQTPIEFKNASKSDVRTQFAALCYRVKQGKPQVLLITSRQSGRWIIPKGWPMDGKTPGESALSEAWEEAGVKGKLMGRSLGLYSYHKDLGTSQEIPCVAMIYPVKVKSLANKYPEKDQRKRKWFSPKKAATKVAEPELAHILESFDPALLQP
jgi:8-oxo-dGTP pyrophosphatase MutT (NUDIX family)